MYLPQSQDTIDSVDLLNTVFLGLCALTTVFVICELCQQISNAFEEFNDMIGQFKWYLFPVKVQRILPTIIINAQQPVYLDCFGSIACNRDTFKRVRAELFLLISFRC